MNYSGFSHTRAFIRNFKDDVRGSMTVFGLFFFMFSGILGAIALDVSSLYTARTHLQVAADQAAHAALYNLNVIGKDDVDSKKAAIAIVEATLPFAQYGAAVNVEGINFGDFDVDTGVFTADVDGVGAVHVEASFTNDKSNAASTFLFRLIGLDSFEIYTSTVVAIFNPACLTEGFVANGVIDMQNQNFFGAGFCIHSNQEIQLQTNNEFADGAVVSMPGGGDSVVVPGANVEDVPGLSDALMDDEIELRVLSRIENMLYQYQNPNGTDFPHPGVSGDEIGWPSYIDGDKTPQNLGAFSEIDSSVLAEGGVYIVDCTNPSKGLTINSGGGVQAPNTAPLPVLKEVIVITPCDVSFGQGSGIQNARIISLSDSSASFTAPSGLSLGSLGADGCETNGAQLVTMGGMSFAADFSAFGSQMFSMGDITFAATPGKENSFKGATMIADGSIDMASHVNAEAGCGTGGNGENIAASYFRIVR